MSSLINRIQRAMLGSAGAEKVRALLHELAIPAGGSGGSMREVRRGFLRPISDEAILRDALADLGLSGGGGGGTQSLSSIRTAILHNWSGNEAALRDGLDGLIEPGDLASGGGASPAWLETFRTPNGDLPRAGFALVGGEVKCWDGTTDEIGIADLITNGTADGSGLIVLDSASHFILSAAFVEQLKFPATYLIAGSYSEGTIPVLNFFEETFPPLKYVSIYHNYVSITSDDFDTVYLEASTGGALQGRTAATVSLTKVAISQDGEATAVSGPGSVDFADSEIASVFLYGNENQAYTGRCTVLFVYGQQADADLISMSTPP